MPFFDFIGVGSPIIDLLARVPDDFLQQHVPGEKGGMVLVDHDEMERIVGLLDKAPARATGGSAANATFNAARLGLGTTFLGKLGHDDYAAAYRSRFEATGVDGSRFKIGQQANARCLALVTPDAQRTMRTCLGAAMTLAPEEITVADFQDCRHAHIEGYLVFNRALADAVLAAARAAGCTTSLDLSSFEVVHASREWLFSQFRRGIEDRREAFATSLIQRSKVSPGRLPLSGRTELQLRQHRRKWQAHDAVGSRGSASPAWPV